MATSKTKNRPRPGAQGGRPGSGNGGRGKRTGARRPPPRRSLYAAFALPLAVVGVFLVVAIALVVLYRTSTGSSTNSGQPVANVKCENSEQLATHYHAHLDILYQGQPVTIPAQVGITSTCLYWLHTHDQTGVIHIEAPKSESGRKFKLGDFFKVWGQPLSSKQVATIQVGSGQQVKAWVNGQPYTGDLAGIPLASKEQVVIEIGPPLVDPPPTFTWDPNTYAQ
jgi:hypothetical protein